MTDAALPAPADWDQPGQLSIVLQGPLFHGNLVETATYCRHWRELFPSAEIIFCISVTDILVGEAIDGVMASPRLLLRLRHDGHLNAAIRIMSENCDLVALAEPALPLPPIKSDRPDKLNNINLQLAAARRGLSLARGRFVLRTRSDLIFRDRSFIAQFEASRLLPRGDAAVFGDRVLISPFYTVNPFTVERMPLHFSDWFHFGLTEDVRSIWDVPPMTLSDSTYYRAHPHASGSNIPERWFNTRIAVEQHIVYECFKRYFPELKLDFHNDQRSIDRSLDILVDNFAVCDLVGAGCLFNKYSAEFTNPDKLFHCIMHEDWRAMAEARRVDYRKTLAPRIREAAGGPAFEGHSGLPRTYPAAQLQTNDGIFLNGEIVGKGSRGTLFFGPYLSGGPGSYQATVNFTALEGIGVLHLRVTHGGGDRVLVETRIDVRDRNRSSFAIAFDVPPPGLSKMEVVCDYKGFRSIACSGVTIVAAELQPNPSTVKSSATRSAVAPVPAKRSAVRLPQWLRRAR